MVNFTESKTEASLNHQQTSENINVKTMTDFLVLNANTTLHRHHLISLS